MWQVYDTRTGDTVSEHLSKTVAEYNRNALNFVRQKDVYAVRLDVRAKNWGDFA